MNLITAAAYSSLSPSIVSHSVGKSADLTVGMAISPFHAPILGLYSTPGDVLEILSEMSWDTLFLLIGLAFVAVAILGNISGKISPGKAGRIAGGIVGAILIACGFWYHSLIHGFKVTLVDVAPPQSQVGPCPLEVNLQGIVNSSGSGDVIYYFEFSNGNASASQTASFTKTDSQIVPGVWQVHDSLSNAWVRLHVIAPTNHISGESKPPFSVTCVPSPATGVQPPISAHAAEPARAPASVQPGVGGRSSALPPPPPPPALTAPATNDSTDSVVLDSALPAPGTYLKSGHPITFNINVTYNLVSADSAILSISTAQLRASPSCKGGSGELTDAIAVPIMRGKHQTSVNLTWSGDTGSATHGRVYGSGYVSFTPMFWANNNGTRGTRIDFFGTYANYCYQFGP